MQAQTNGKGIIEMSQVSTTDGTDEKLFKREEVAEYMQVTVTQVDNYFALLTECGIPANRLERPSGKYPKSLVELLYDAQEATGYAIPEKRWVKNAPKISNPNRIKRDEFKRNMQTRFGTKVDKEKEEQARFAQTADEGQGAIVKGSSQLSTGVGDMGNTVYEAARKKARQVTREQGIAGAAKGVQEGLEDVDDYLHEVADEMKGWL